MGSKVNDPDALHGRWVHSQEEDTEAGMVFRPAGFKLPPARGRAGFELRPDQTYVETGVGPADVPEQQRGTWGLETTGDDETVIRVTTESGQSRDLKIIEAGPDRLVVSTD